MAPSSPSPRPRRAGHALFIGASVLALAALAAFWIYGHRVHLRALGGARWGGFTPVPAFVLRDSLPALEGGLSNLEAFKVTMNPVWRADNERSLWISDSLTGLTLEFLTRKNPFDSVTLFAWWTGGRVESRTFTGVREPVWTLSPARRVRDWVEVVTVYLSDPPLLSMRASDSTVRLFEQAEGRVFHVVEGWYLGRRERPVVPDTSYALAAQGEGLGLMVRGDALAVVNPAPRPVRLRVLESGSTRTDIVEADSSGVSVYRTFMRGRGGAIVAYTGAGEPYPVFHTKGASVQEFFVLRQ
jgi:hypothetical protein